MQELLKFLDLTTLDATMILVSIPLFVLFIKGADKALIRPFLDRLNARDALTIGAGTSAEEIVNEAVALEQDYARKTGEARAVAAQAKNEKLSAAKEEASKIVHDAEAEVSARVSSERQKVRQELETQRAALLKDVDSLAKEIVNKLSQPRAISSVALLLSVLGAGMLLGGFSDVAYASTEAVVEHAAEHGGHEAGHAASHGYGYLVWYWINFGVYLTAMYFILRKTVINGWDARRERIRYALEAGKRSMDEANARRSAAKAQMAQADQQVKEIAASLAKESELEAQKMLSDAREKAKDIQESATESLGLEVKAQRSQMQREIAELVLARAQEMLRTTVTKESDRALRLGAVSGVKSLVQ